MLDTPKKRANLFRFGLMALPPIAWGVTFAYLFLIANGLRVDWVSAALVPSLMNAIVVGLLCFVVWYGYQKYVPNAKEQK